MVRVNQQQGHRLVLCRQLSRVAGLMACLLSLALAEAPKTEQIESKEMRMLHLRLEEATLRQRNAESQLAKKESELKEVKQLLHQGLYSKIDVNRVENEYNDIKLARDQATINLEKAQLDFLNDASRVTLEKASTFRDLDGTKHVLLVMRNTSNIQRIIDNQGKYTENQKKALVGIENLTVKVSLRDNLIGRPFEVNIPNLAFDESDTIDFVLQQETDNLTVHLLYGGREYRLPVYLEKESRDDRVIVRAAQFAQEGEAGDRVAYDLALEHLVDEDKDFTPEVLNLPPMLQRECIENNIRVSRIRFKKEQAIKSVRLVIDIATDLPQDLVDKKIVFFVLMLDRFSSAELDKIKNKNPGGPILAADLVRAKLAFETLELTPHGKAALIIEGNNALYKIKSREVIRFAFKVTNQGTIDCGTIKVKLNTPADWSYELQPDSAIALSVATEQMFKAVLRPASQLAVGDYEVRIEATSQCQGRSIKAASRVLHMLVENKTNWVLLGALLGGGLAAGIAGGILLAGRGQKKK